MIASYLILPEMATWDIFRRSTSLLGALFTPQSITFHIPPGFQSCGCPHDLMMATYPPSVGSIACVSWLEVLITKLLLALGHNCFL